MQRALKRRFAACTGKEMPEVRGRRAGKNGRLDPCSQLVFEEVNWSAALQYRENRLWQRLQAADGMRYPELRRFLVDFAADAIAYQPATSERTAYDAIHREVAATLARLAERAGPRAPLCIVSHSLGTVIASNYVYDLVKRHDSFMGRSVSALVNGTPVERGETLALMYTMGSPIALWSLRYPRFGEPVQLPAPALARHHPGLKTQWINLYDPHDVVGYPLRPLNAAYRAAVTEDRPVGVGWLLTSWNPLCHLGYWNNGGVADQISRSLADVWRQSTGLAIAEPRRTQRVARVRKTG
jgi:hypothetical protein